MKRSMRTMRRTTVAACLLMFLPVPAPGQPPTTLADAVESALEQNPEVRRAREQPEEFNLRVRAVRADALPNLDLVGGAQRTRDPGLRNSPFFSRLQAGGDPLPPEAFSAFNFDTYFYQAELEQPLFQFGRVGHALEAARRELEGVETDIRTVENRVAFDVSRAYYDLLFARERERVLEAEAEARARQLQQVRDQLEFGEATRLDLLQAEVALANLRPEVLAADNEVRVALTRLNETLGRDPLAPFAPAGTLETTTLPDLPETRDLLRLASERRPELRRFQLTRSVLQEAEGVTRADTLPEVNARATLGISSFAPDNLARLAFHGWTVGVNVRWTLFDGSRTSATIGQFRSQRRQSEFEEESFRARLARDLERASGDWRQASELVRVGALAVEQSREARRVAEELFSLGAATFLNVLDAERAVRQAELSQLQAYHAARSALAEVKMLVGLQPDAPDAMLSVDESVRETLSLGGREPSFAGVITQP